KALPVLIVDGETIHDSTRIIERLERLRPEPALYPADDAERRRALALEDFFDEELGPHVRRALFHELLPETEFAAAAFTLGFGPGTRRPRCTAATAARRRRSPRDRATCPLALPHFALQREGALGARLEGHPARAARARDELRAAGAVGDRAGEAAHPVSRRAGDRRLDAHRRGARAPPARPAALPARRGGTPAGARARGLLRRGGRSRGPHGDRGAAVRARSRERGERPHHRHGCRRAARRARPPAGGCWGPTAGTGERRPRSRAEGRAAKTAVYRIPRSEPLYAVELAQSPVERAQWKVPGLARDFEDQAVGETERRRLSIVPEG